MKRYWKGGTCSLGKSLQAAEDLCQAAFSQPPAQAHILPRAACPQGWARWGIRSSLLWWDSLLVHLDFVGSTLQFNFFPLPSPTFPLFLLQVSIYDKYSTLQTQSQCLLLGNPACDNILFPLFCLCYELYIFSDIKPTLHFCNKLKFIITHYFFYILMNFVC